MQGWSCICHGPLISIFYLVLMPKSIVCFTLNVQLIPYASSGAHERKSSFFLENSKNMLYLRGGKAKPQGEHPLISYLCVFFNECLISP